MDKCFVETHGLGEIWRIFFIYFITSFSALGLLIWYFNGTGFFILHTLEQRFKTIYLNF